MPRRKYFLGTGEYYHVFNRSIDGRPIFDSLKDCKRALNIINYYKHSGKKIRFSKYLLLNKEMRKLIWTDLKSKTPYIEIVSFCLMPNHYHLLLQQQLDNGITKFIQDFQNSYSRFFNTKYKRVGTIWQGQFKARHIENDEQLLHVNRYIHLNPYTSYIVKSLEALKDYPWSSLREYLQKANVISNGEIIRSNFNDITSYIKFVFDQADYQRELDRIKHLVIE